MSLFNADTLEKEAQWNKPIIPFAENFYLCTIQNVEVVEVDKTDWTTGFPVKTNEKEQNVKVTFALPEDSKAIDGTEPTFNTISYWFDPTKTGISKRGPTKAREFLTTLMDWDLKAKIDTTILQDLIENNKMIGKEIKLMISVVNRDDGSQKNKIEKFSKK